MVSGRTIRRHVSPPRRNRRHRQGQAFHAVYGGIHTTVGSYGCVNLEPADARKLWSVLKKGDRVYVWGRRVGS